MAIVAFVFLALLGASLQAFVSLGAQRPETQLFCRSLLLLYPCFALEFAWHAALGNRQWGQHAFFCLVPPLRLLVRDHDKGEAIWLPLAGWRRLGPGLGEGVEQALATPMLLVSVLVLPLLSLEYYGAALIERTPALRFGLDVGQAVAWFAFAVEFTVKVSVAPRPALYCLRHWLDLAIICLPFAAFLRLARLGQVARLSRAAKAARSYRLKGVRARVYGASTVQRFAWRLLHIPPEVVLDRLHARLAEVESQAALLREEIAHLETPTSAAEPPGASRQPNPSQAPEPARNSPPRETPATAPRAAAVDARPKIVPRRRAA